MASLLAAAAALEAKPLPRIGLLGWTACETSMSSPQGEWTFVLKGLAEFGYRPNENVTIECRSVNGRFEQFGLAANELAKIPVDIIVAGSDSAINAAVLATHVIPIVSIQSTLYGNSFSAPRVSETPRTARLSPCGAGKAMERFSIWTSITSASDRARRAARRPAG